MDIFLWALYLTIVIIGLLNFFMIIGVGSSDDFDGLKEKIVAYFVIMVILSVITFFSLLIIMFGISHLMLLEK